MADRTKRGGAEIVELIKTGSSVAAPAVAVSDMVEAILLDEQRILPSCAMLTGQWGIEGAYVGAPVRLGTGGIQEVYEIPVSDSERAELVAAGEAVKELVEATPSA